MNDPRIDIPPGLQLLWDNSGPIIRYRILRDLLDRDDTWLETATLSRQIQRLEQIGSLLVRLRGLKPDDRSLLSFAADEDGEYAFLSLCEAGQSRHDMVQSTVTKLLLPILTDAEHLTGWGTVGLGSDAPEMARDTMRRLIRDASLFMICRALPGSSDYLRPQLESVLTEMEQFASGGDGPWPTRAGYMAVCWYPWGEDEFPRIRQIALALLERLEKCVGDLAEHPLLRARFMEIVPKEEYVHHPALMLLELESAARLGVVRDAAVTRWLLEELEGRQDADGLFRFVEAESPPASSPYSWYFPLEARSPEDHSTEYSFRALLIFKLLGYDF